MNTDAADAAFVPWKERDGWTDVVPIPQAESEHPLVPINYSQEYTSAMSTFRYILSQQELSKRVLELTGEIVKMNPAHYTVWAYRSKTLLSLRDSEPNGKGRQLLIDELALLDALVKVHLKNYQVWQHRRVIVVALDDASRELPFTTKALAYDSKNYHTWAYRQWALSHFYARVAAAPAAEAHTKVWEDELEFTHHLLVTDVRNNSAWNHRWFTVFGRKEGASSETIDREIRYTQKKLELAPNNPSAWNYLRGILDRHSLPYAPFTQWARDLRSPADPTEDREGRVVLAVEFVADALAQQGNAADAVRAYEALKTLDAMRVNYWAQRQAMAEEVRVR